MTVTRLQPTQPFFTYLTFFTVIPSINRTAGSNVAILTVTNCFLNIFVSVSSVNQLCEADSKEDKWSYEEKYRVCEEKWTEILLYIRNIIVI